MIKDISRIFAIPIALLILSAVSIVPAFACTPGTPCSASSGNTLTGPGKATGQSLDYDIKMVQLSGKEKQTLITEALDSPDGKYLKEQLSNRDLTENKKLATVYRMSISNQSFSSTVTYLQLPFTSDTDNLSATLMYFTGNDLKMASATIEGNENNMPAVMNILKENVTYQELLASENVAGNVAQFSVKEVITGESDQAVINSNDLSVDGSKLIAVVDVLQKGTNVVALALSNCDACMIVVGAIIGSPALFVDIPAGCGALCSGAVLLAIVGFFLCCVICVAALALGLGIVMFLGSSWTCKMVGYCPW